MKKQNFFNDSMLKENLFNLTKFNFLYFKKIVFTYVALGLSVLSSIFLPLLILLIICITNSTSKSGISGLGNLAIVSPFYAGIFTTLFIIILISVKQKDENKNGIWRNKILTGNSRLQILASEYIASFIIFTLYFIIAILANIIVFAILIGTQAKVLSNPYYQNLGMQAFNSYCVGISWLITILLLNSLFCDLKLKFVGFIFLAVLMISYYAASFTTSIIQENEGLFTFTLFSPMTAIQSCQIKFGIFNYTPLHINTDSYNYMSLTLIPWDIICAIGSIYVWSQKELK